MIDIEAIDKLINSNSHEDAWKLKDSAPEIISSLLLRVKELEQALEVNDD